MLTVTPPQNSLQTTSHWLQEPVQELTCHRQLRYAFTASRAASCMYFQHQNCRSKVFEAGYWKNFQKAETLSFFFIN
jgi:hypothetical protein